MQKFAISQQRGIRLAFYRAVHSQKRSMAGMAANTEGTGNRYGNSNNGNKKSHSFFGASDKKWILGIGAIGLFASHLLNNIAENCGIVGVVSDDSDEASEYLIEGLTILKNRGYDSAGIASVSKDGQKLSITKYASEKTTSDSIDRVAGGIADHKGHSIGIAHTRWATHGGKTDANAHPHTDYKNRIAVVHNGTINNAYELKKGLVAEGIKFTSETDTEVIAHLIGKNLDRGENIKDAVSHALSLCDGSWGLAVIHKDSPKQVVVACNGSPMTIGLGRGKTFIASETSAFSKYTKSFISMKDGEIGVIRASDSEGVDIGRIEQAPENDVLLTPAPYPHFTIKECIEQPEAIARALGHGARMNGNRIVLGGLDTNIGMLAEIKNMIITGCGTSKQAAELGARIMRDLACFDTVQVLDAAELDRSTLPLKNGGLLAVSQSGETKDVFRAVTLAQNEAGIPVLSVVNSVGSLIARSTGMGVYLNAGREHAVASTKAFSTQVTVLALIALWFRQTREDKEGLPESKKKKALLEALQRLPISFGMGLRSRGRCKEIAKELKDKETMFVLGKGYSEPIAMEGALKIKEMCYLHAEGYSGGALKHGPLALIEGQEGKFGQTPVVCIILDDEHSNHMRTCAEECKARGAKVYVITDKATLAQGLDDKPLVINTNGPLTSVLAVLPLQLIAYELAMLKGINPDTPRNLAKSVTVD